MAQFTLPDIHIHFDPEGLAKLEELVMRLEKAAQEIAQSMQDRYAEITRLRAALEEIANYDTGSYQSQRANRALKGGE